MHTNNNEFFIKAGNLLETAVLEGFRSNIIEPKELGGTHGCKEHMNIIKEIIKEL